MEILINKYEEKMARAGFAGRGSALMIFSDPPFVLDGRSESATGLEKVLAHLGRAVLLFVEPAEPYKTIIDYLAETSPGAIYPQDFETRIFLHDLPVIDGFNHEEMAAALKQRRGIIIRGRGIVTTARSLEAAFVTVSSVCFSCFVKFFTDYLVIARQGARQGNVDRKRRSAFIKASERLEALPEFEENLKKGPFAGEEAILSAMAEAGKMTVASRLVDSNFGNISYRHKDTLYISRTGSALDELENGIVRVSLAGGKTVPKTVSTEFPAHREILTMTENRAVLHGHPKFTVILSMACDRPQCECKDLCQTDCPYERSIAGVPIVPGEAGDGPCGLSHTVPPAMVKGNAAIVYGHGLFTAGRLDYNEAFKLLLSTEKACRQNYFGFL